MKIELEGVTYTLDPDHIRLGHARVIQRFTGLSIDEWADSINAQAGPDEDGTVRKVPAEWIESVAALYWLMLAQSGDETPIEDVDFDVSGFYQLFLQARLKELQALLDQQKAADPTKPRPNGRKGAPTGSRARSSRTTTTLTPRDQPEGEAAIAS